MSTQSNHPEEEKLNEKKFRPVVFMMAIIYIVVFLGITTPLMLLWGPYENTRKVVISTVLGTRHSYLVTDFLSQDAINKILGVNNTVNEVTENVAEKSETDLNKIRVKYTSGNEITRYDIHTDRYNGYVLEIKNPLGVKVAMTKYLGKIGQKTSEMAEEHNAIAAINGGAFVDESSDGTLYAGTGAEPGGFVISDGKVIYPKTNVKKDNVENVIAFTKGGQLIVGDHTLEELQKLDVKEAMCFRRPNIIINGKPQVKDKMSDGLNPRTAVGQKEDGTVIFLVIDGRKITAPGASIYDVQQIMLDRGAINAGALDGGYSSTMYYKGEVINSPNAWDGERSVATAFYVE
ncbi:exopolysaccharide biosynthesis protein [Clostridium chromiireducens]|uniref:Exopolysaccharide biosynthesis protein n=1 Tax=Clostridium chromiireducens TaxID=225345 RepID=A0A964W499_9CLOT|nr:phosphodiester glycosidase family protein [Clostridium chromiireducens]MVX65993.1 exopolysaccharide biosynthesis protein [Clostridium chromiireducens]